jgi:hypothetical protein
MPATWFDGVSLTAEAALSAATGTYGAWNAGLWNTATWGPEEQWTDISAYLRALRSDRKFSREVQAWDAGSGEVVLSNRDGRFASDNMDSPYVVAGVSGIRPWRPFRWSATYNGVTYPIYTGYGLDPVETWAAAHADAYVTWPCTDEMAALADVDGLEQAPQGAGETSGLRVHRILNSAGHTGARSIAPGRVTLQETTLAQNVATELKLVADSEGGALFVDADGTVVFEDQYALLENPRSRTVQATFGDGSGGDDELPCTDVTPEDTGSLIRNIVSLARVGGTAQTVVDETSRALYRSKRHTRTDLLCETDTQVLELATWYLEQYKAPARRFSKIQVNPRADPEALYPAVLGLRVRDLVRVVARPIGRPTVTRDCHIAGIHHDISRDTWTTTFDLWDASVYQAYATSLWETAVWDGGAAWFF